jgi:hypothetical protein
MGEGGGSGSVRYGETPRCNDVTRLLDALRHACLAEMPCFVELAACAKVCQMCCWTCMCCEHRQRAVSSVCLTF